MGPIPSVCGGFQVFIEKIDLEKIREKNWLELLSKLEVGESV